MVTIIYNTIKNEVEHSINGEYLVDGKLGIVDAPLIKLIEVRNNIPTYNPKTQTILERWEVQGNNYVQVWTVVNKTEAELIAEKEAEANEADQTLSVEEVKKLLRMSADSLTEAELYQFPSVYPAWKPGVAVQVNEKYQYGGKLYKVVQGHTTQLDWTPDIVPALFTVYNPPEIIPVFVQPTGAHDVYMKGDKVRFPDVSSPVWESLIDNNSWSPVAYPAGWELIS